MSVTCFYDSFVHLHISIMIKLSALMKYESSQRKELIKAFGDSPLFVFRKSSRPASSISTLNSKVSFFSTLNSKVSFISTLNSKVSFISNLNSKVSFYIVFNENIFSYY